MSVVRVGSLVATLALALGVAPVAHGAEAPASHRPKPKFSFLHVGAPAGPGNLPQVLDAAGRQVLLRGVNVVGLRDSYVPDGSMRPPYPMVRAPYRHGSCPEFDGGVGYAPLCRKDARQIAALGYNSVRITVSWSQLEPTPGVINTAYIDRIAQTVGWFKARGVYSVIDMHNDAWSKYVVTPDGFPCPPPTEPVTGEHEADGAPEWASQHKTPVCAVGGVRDLDTAVQEDFTSFYQNLPAPDGVGLADHYAAVLTALAKRFGNDPSVAGYEILNEPEPGINAPGAMDTTTLYPFYAKMIAAMRAGVPGFKQLVFIEPDVTRNILDQSVNALPWSTFSDYPNVVYAPHVYTDIFTLNSLLGVDALKAAYPANGGWDSSAADARTLGLPLWVGEFGNGLAEDGTLLRTSYDNQDRLGIGSSLWMWKCRDTSDQHPCNWSVRHSDDHGVDALNPSRARFSDRTYPLYTAGTLTSMTYDPDTGASTIRATSDRVRPGNRAKATVIHIPASATGALTATGARVKVLTRPRGARLAFVFPRGGVYTVSIAGNTRK